MEEKVRNFEEDLRNSNNPKLREDWIRIIKLKFGEDSEVIWKDNQEAQKNFGTDVIVKTNKGRRYSIELKTRNNGVYKNDKWIMEIINLVYDKSDRETRKFIRSYEGWIYTTTAEYIFHATLNEEGESIIECIFYSLIPFKTEMWKSKFQEYKNFFIPTKFPNGNFQLTLNKLIPKEEIKKEAVEFWEWSQNE